MTHEKTRSRTRNYANAISCLFVFLSAWFSVAGEARAAGATLSIAPANGEFGLEERVEAVIRLHSGGNSVNAAEASLNFSPEVLRAVSISKARSIFAFWPVEPSIDNQRGVIQFAGGTSSAFSESNGILLTITFSVKKIGEGALNFSGGRILLADGSGTDVFAAAQGANWKLTAAKVPTKTIGIAPRSPVVNSSTHPDPDRWYSKNNPKFFWELPSDVTGVSIALDRRPLTDPGLLSDGLINEKSFENIADGEWYFHAKFRNKAGWGAVTHRKVLIDTRPPDPFSFMFADGRETANPQPVVLFSTTDSLSGISYYELRIGDGDFFTLPVAREHNPYRLPVQAPGKRALLVRAYDQAGNFTAAPEEEFTILPQPKAPVTIFYLKVAAAILLLISVILGYVLNRLLRSGKRIQREVHEAESALHKAFDLLRGDVEEQLKLLEKTKTRRELTEEETKILRRLKRDLDDAEQFVRKEIEDVERVFDGK